MRVSLAVLDMHSWGPRHMFKEMSATLIQDLEVCQDPFTASCLLWGPAPFIVSFNPDKDSLG